MKVRPKVFYKACFDCGEVFATTWTKKIRCDACQSKYELRKSTPATDYKWLDAINENIRLNKGVYKSDNNQTNR